MRIFLAGGSGVLGRSIIPMLIDQGHVVSAITRSAEKTQMLQDLRAEAIVCDVLDKGALTAAIDGFGPHIVLDQLTDLPADANDLNVGSSANARTRIEATLNIVSAIKNRHGVTLIAQSAAWTMPEGRGADAVAPLESIILGRDGIILRYGQLYGPDTYHPNQPPTEPRVHIDTAALRTLNSLTAPPRSIITITD